MPLKLRSDWEQRQRDGIVAQFASTEVIVLLAKDTSSAAAVGLLHGHIADHLVVEERAGFVDNAYVVPEMRGRGVLAEMLSVAESWFAERGAAFAELYVMTANEEGREVWLAKGFEPYMDRLRKELR